MNFNQKTYVFRFKNICFLFLDSENTFFFSVQNNSYSAKN